MSIRKYTNPRDLDVSRGLQDVLRRNGLQAHLSMNEDGSLKLIVVGHDSPILKYDITRDQAEKMMNWGSVYANKTAYNTLTSIIRKDFDMPDGFVAARNVGGRVVAGLHGYRIGHGEYGYNRYAGIPAYRPFDRCCRGWGGDFLAWSPRQQPGWHIRRVHDSPMVVDRPDGRFKPGELRSGGYGFYYKGSPEVKTQQNVLDDPILNVKIKPYEAAPRPQGQAKPYGDLITSEVYFTADSWKECLDSHGVVIKDDEKLGGKTLLIQSSDTRVDLAYHLKDDEYAKLTSNTLSGTGGVSIDDRLAIINKIVSQDFNTPVTREMLETKELIDIKLKPEVKQEVEKIFIERDKQIAAQQQRIADREALREASRAERERLGSESERIARDPQAINGREIRAILGNEGFYASRAHGREMVIGEIRVDKTGDKDYVMTAEINGAEVSHKISKTDFENFKDLDDAHRLRLFDQVFTEVEIKRDSRGRDNGAPVLDIKDENGKYVTREKADIQYAKSNSVDGASLSELKESKGFYREIQGGREVEVGEISVTKVSDDKYRMSAVIDGETVSHDISQRQYEKFMAVDDYQRMKMFSKIFPEVDMKTRPGMGVNVGAAILAAVVAGTELAHDITHMVAPVMGPPMEPHRPNQDLIYSKPGVVSPVEVMQQHYNYEMASRENELAQEYHRGL